MSDQYIEKNISLEGRLVAEAFFKNSMGYFVIKGSDNNLQYNVISRMTL
jgi:hypothetical protein